LSTLAECLSTLSHQEVETAARHALSGEKTTNEILKKLFTSISGHTSSIGHSNEAASYAKQSYFHCGITMALQLYSLLSHHVMSAALE